MNHVLTLLHQLDQLYHEASLSDYEQTLQATVEQVQQTFPGFTIAYAEISTSGAERNLHCGMRHVLVPLNSVQ